jgi:hypothetical protein
MEVPTKGIWFISSIIKKMSAVLRLAFTRELSTTKGAYQNGITASNGPLEAHQSAPRCPLGAILALEPTDVSASAQLTSNLLCFSPGTGTPSSPTKAV